MMLVRAFLSDDRLYQNAKPLTIPTALRLDQVKQKVCACYSCLLAMPSTSAHRTDRH
jgi:hypothetical protein